MRCPAIRLPLLLAALLALARFANAAPEPDPLEGIWKGSVEEKTTDGGTIRYRAELRILAPDEDGHRDAVFDARTTVKAQDGRELAVAVKGRFRSAEPGARRLQAPDVTVDVEANGGPKSIGARWLVIDSIEGNRLRGRIGSDTDGWSSVDLEKQEAAPDPSRKPSQSLGEKAAVYSLLSTLPGVEELSPPAWAKEGVRLSFWMGSATISNDTGKSTLTADPNGSLIDPSTGAHYSESALPGGSGAVGFTQLDFITVAPDAVIIQVTNFLHDGTLERPSRMESTQLLCHPSGCEYWIHPKALQKLAAMAGFVFTGRREVNGESREVVVVKDGNGHSVYDAATGIMVSMSMRATSNKPAIYYDPATHTGTSGKRTGTTLIVNQFRGLRQTYRGRLGGMDLPSSVDDLKGIEARTVRTFQMDAGGGVQKTSGTVKIEPVRRSGNRLIVKVTSTLLGQPAGSKVQVASPVEEGGLFLPTEYIESLEQGQALDEDPVTGYAVKVAYVGDSQDGRPIAVITRAGATQSASFVYDRRTGMLIVFDQMERAVGTTTRLHLEVTRTW